MTRKSTQKWAEHYRGWDLEVWEEGGCWFTRARCGILCTDAWRMRTRFEALGWMYDYIDRQEEEADRAHNPAQRGWVVAA
jgi:hypothetical protein